MRDVHRMKEKFDLSFDSRQIVSALIGALVVLSAVFVLGVVVGKKLATSDGASEAPDLLSALDQKAAAMEEVKDGSAELTFEDELTKKAPAEPKLEAAAPAKPAVEPKEEKVEKPARAPEPVKQEEAEPQKLAVAPTPEPKPEAKPEAVAVVAEPKPKVETRPEATGEVKPKVATDAALTRTNPRDGGLKDALARAEKRPAEAAPNGQFTLQLSASQSRAEADRFAGQLRDKGYAPYIVEATVAGRGTWYRVRMGSFATRDAAQRYLTDFRRETQLEAFVAGRE